MAVTQRQMEAGLAIVRAVADAVKALGTEPSGHLYARVMGRLSLSEYQQIIGMLVRARVIEQRGDVLHWVA